ncbi:hypothetical protein KFE25_008528 [Diacronema lutheri]|uniref:Ribosome recycling factor domain-containing protein n=1 Tax=Diacronema lutheri TaxID=2081491 RepID=A0A8J6CCQ1_DIALT|nr:hypothetical protein KFE25_008528 [Diacronema lutheri]
MARGVVRMCRGDAVCFARAVALPGALRAPPPLALAAVSVRLLATKGAKGKARAKPIGKGGSDAAADDADDDVEEDGAAGLDMGVLRQRMDASVARFVKELAPLRPGRAVPGMLDHVLVPAADGSGPSPLAAVGRVVVRDPQKLEVTVFDPALASAVAKAIAAAGLELNPSFERNVVHVPLPRITADQRRALVKAVHALAEKAKTTVRKLRQAALKQAKALEKQLPKDELKRLEGQVQALTDAAVKQLGDASAAKEKELLEG